ncbi:hypothetical protein SALBM135S_00956 [Streptomyces alboniger]
MNVLDARTAAVGNRPADRGRTTPREYAEGITGDREGTSAGAER